MNTSLSIFARALATENLSFSFDVDAPTASFDTKTRHLIMPVWDVSETLQTMLVAHEISHALWTPQDRADVLFAEAEKQGYNSKHLHRICNVVEDVRIERMMKHKYPGTRRDFFLGYKEIIDKDMFGLSGMDFNQMNMVNRLNIHFKWGVPGFIDLPLNAEETMIAEMIEKCETFDDVFMVAKYLYDHPAMKDEKEKAESEGSGNGGDKDGEPNGKGGQANGKGSGIMDISSDIGKKSGQEYTATTLTISPLENLKDSIITTQNILSAYDKGVNGNEYGQPPLNLEEYRKFVRESDAFVRQLVAQFERRKAADEIRRERPKQTGMLNLDRLHQYRTHDDIFISKIVKQDGKNHGIVFMIDLSGSMGHVLGDCVLQVLQLVWFCEKAKIPFEVFGFTDGVWSDADYEKEYKAFIAKNGEDACYDFRYSKSPRFKNPRANTVNNHNGKLYCFASSRDSAADRERLLAYLYESYVTKNRTRVVSMSGTPTVECVAMATQFMQEWITANNIQIPTIMVVTDGEPNGVYLINDSAENIPYHMMANNVLTVNNEILGTVHRIDGMRIGHRNIANLTIATMLDGMKDKFNARRIGMYVGQNTFGENLFAHFCITQKEYEEMDGKRYSANIGASERFAAAKEAYKDGALLLPLDRFPGYDAYFLIRTPKIVKDEDAIVESGTFTKIKNTFVKTMAKRSGSRVFLTRYVDIVAGQPIRGQDDAIYRLPWYKTS